MATPTAPPVPLQTCVLTAGIKCCKGCQTKAKKKLLSVSGVSAVEYNTEQGLLIVSGDTSPEALLCKLAQWGKKAELVSVLQGIPGSVSGTPEPNQAKTMEEKKKKRPTKCFLLRCFGKRSTKVKVEPYRGPWAENPTATLLYRPQAMPGYAVPYPAPCFGPSQSPLYTRAGVFQPPPPPPPPPPHSPSYFQFPHMVNSTVPKPNLY